MAFKGQQDRTTGIRSVRADRLSVGLFIPVSGTAGIWGPSCRACAELAAAEINRRGGIGGREIALVTADAGGLPEDAADQALGLVEEAAIDAIVGMHTSDIRKALAAALGGRVPYVYTPLYEGGETMSGVFCIGETPAAQLIPAIEWLVERYRLKRWFLIGNDYVWPHTVHRLVRRRFRRTGLAVAGEAFMGFGARDFGPAIGRIAHSRADAVLVSLVGEDAIMFNRAFARSGLANRVVRFSCAVEENSLLAIGADRTEGMFAASGYFGALATRENGAFRERYHQRFGDRAPTLNTIGQSVYEGMYFLEGLAAATAQGDWRRPGRPIPVGGARSSVFTMAGRIASAIYLAESAGHEFRILQPLGC